MEGTEHIETHNLLSTKARRWSRDALVEVLLAFLRIRLSSFLGLRVSIQAYKGKVLLEQRHPDRDCTSDALVCRQSLEVGLFDNFDLFFR